MGSAALFFDADGDGWLDVLLVNGKDWTPRGHRTTAALYRNNHDGTFTDVTRGSGLDIEIYGMGVAIGDYDNDGRDDLYITAFGGDHLFHNEGSGHFRDVTRDSGIQNAGFSSSAAWLDYDRDGKLDLFVTNYVQWTPAGDLRCSLDGSTKSYCTPESYKGTAPKLYHNLGNGKFAVVTAAAGLADQTSKSLGVVVFDYNNDGWPDLFVANDTQPNKLYRNLHDGRFKEEGVPAGVAFGEDGVARGAMGVDAGDYDRSGRAHLIVGNFSNQMLGLYHNEGNGLFVDEAPQSAVGRASLLTLTFGLFFFDYDLDGHPDILAANGHIEEEIGRVQPKIQYQATSAPLLMHQQPDGENSSRWPHSRARWLPAARRTETLTATVISMFCSPPTTAPPTSIATMAAIAITGCSSSWWGRRSASQRDRRRGPRRCFAGGTQWQTVPPADTELSQQAPKRSRADLPDSEGKMPRRP